MSFKQGITISNAIRLFCIYTQIICRTYVCVFFPCAYLEFKWILLIKINLKMNVFLCAKSEIIKLAGSGSTDRPTAVSKNLGQVSLPFKALISLTLI